MTTGPMPRIRDSGVPALELWEEFFDAPGILEALGCDPCADVLEFGCGYGTFAIAAARRVTGTVYALDIDPLMVRITCERAQRAGLSNLIAEERDFVAFGSGRPAQSIGFAMLFNILHAEQPVVLLREAHRVARPEGRVAVIHWKHTSTPRGPPLEVRPRPETCREWARQAGFASAQDVELPGSPWHWGMVLEPGVFHSPAPRTRAPQSGQILKR